MHSGGWFSAPEWLSRQVFYAVSALIEMSLSPMKILKEVTFEEVFSCHERENRGSPSFDYTEGRLRMANVEFGGLWTLVVLRELDILRIVLPAHRHPAELIPETGLPVSVAAKRVRELTGETGVCWENILSHRDRDFSLVHIFVKFNDGVLTHLDGLHRLLAWALFEKYQEVSAYVAGFAVPVDYPSVGQ